MIIHCQLKFDDVLALQRDVIKHSYTHYIKRMYFKWVSAVLLFLAIWLIFHISLTSAMAAAVITAIYVFIFPSLYTKAAMARAKGQMQQQDLSHITGPSTITLTDEGIERDKDDTVKHFSWNEFIKLGEDDHHFFLYKSDLQGLILPKELANKSQDETGAYQTHIKSQVTSSGSTMSSAITETHGKDTANEDEKNDP